MRARTGVWTRLLVSGAALTLASGLGAQNAPLPDRETFVRQVRERLLSIDSAQHRYVFQITRREQSLDEAGRPTDDSVKVYESHPGLPGEERWERLLAVDGEPVPDDELAAQDRERARDVREATRRGRRDPEGTRERQARAWEEYQREMRETVDDIFRVYDIRMVGRALVGGHPTILFALTPRADADPATDSGARMRSFSIRAWVSESDHELVRLEAESLRPTTVWWGLLARIHAGSTVSYERRQIDGKDWLPAHVAYRGSARIGLVRVVRRSGTVEYSGYRQVTSDGRPPAGTASD